MSVIVRVAVSYLIKRALASGVECHDLARCIVGRESESVVTVDRDSFRSAIRGASATNTLSASDYADCVGSSLPDQSLSHGLGDIVAAGLASVGITKELVAAVVGGDCGCAKRQEALNDLGRKFGIG